MSRNDGSYDGSANSFVDRKLFVGGLSHNVTEDDLRRYFSTQGEVESITMTSNQTTGKPKGHAFVVMVNRDDYERILTTDHRLDGRVMNISRAVKIREAKYAPAADVTNTPSSSAIDNLLAEVSEPETKVYLTGVQECTAEGIKDYFRHFGDVADVSKPNTEYAVVTFVKAEDAEKVLRQTTHYVFGKMVSASRTAIENISGTKRTLEGFKPPGHQYVDGASAPDGNDAISYTEDRIGSVKAARTETSAAPSSFHHTESAPTQSQAPQAMSRVPTTEASKPALEGRRIFVGNLYNVELTEVTDYFEKFGAVENAEFKHDELGNFKGFGFLSFKSEAVVQKLLNESHYVGGKRIYINLATERKASKGGVDASSKREDSVPKDQPVSTDTYYKGDPYAGAVSDDNNSAYYGHTSAYGRAGGGAGYYNDHQSYSAPQSYGSDYNSDYGDSGYYQHTSPLPSIAPVVAATVPVKPSGIVGDKDYRSVDEILAAAAAAAAAKESRDYIPPHKLAAAAGIVNPAAGSSSSTRDYRQSGYGYNGMSSSAGDDYQGYSARDYVPPSQLAAKAGPTDSGGGGAGYRDYLPPHQIANPAYAPNTAAAASGANTFVDSSRDYVPPHKLTERNQGGSGAMYSDNISASSHYDSRDYVPPQKLAAAAGMLSNSTDTAGYQTNQYYRNGNAAGLPSVPQYDQYESRRDYVPPQKLAASMGIMNNQYGSSVGSGYDSSRDYVPPHKLAAGAGISSSSAGSYAAYDNSRDYVPPHKLAAGAGVSSASAGSYAAYDNSRDYVPPHKLAASAGIGSVNDAYRGLGGVSYDSGRDYVPPHKLAAAAGIVNSGNAGSAMGPTSSSYDSRDYIPPHKLAAAAGIASNSNNNTGMLSNSNGVFGSVGYDGSRDYVPPQKLAASMGNNQYGSSVGSGYDNSRDYVPPHKLAAGAGISSASAGSYAAYDNSRDYVPPHKLAAAAGLLNTNQQHHQQQQVHLQSEPVNKPYDSSRDYIPPHKLAAMQGRDDRQW